jgi:hypothetical protein
MSESGLGRVKTFSCKRSELERVDRTSKPHPRRCQTWEANVRVIPLDSGVPSEAGQPIHCV